MTIPDFQTIMLPLLEFLSDGEDIGPRNRLDDTASDSWAGESFGQRVRDG